jgi:Flp pilus assembly protein TadG
MKFQRLRNERASTIVGFALVFPVMMAATATALFAGHAYDVKSDLQRTAQEAARYAATRCDPRGTYAAGSGCAAGTTYPNSADVVAYVNAKFTGHNPKVTFIDNCGASLSDTAKGLYCETLDPATPTTPAPNQRLTVTLQYRFTSPMDPLLHIMPGASGLADLKVAGDAVVE